MARKVTADTFADVINEVLADYAADTEKTTADVVKEVTRDGVKALKSASGIFNGTRYASGWTSKVEVGRMTTTGIIYNGKVPGLPHLLEYGHATRGGGRKKGDHEHIKPVEETICTAFERGLELRL